MYVYIVKHNYILGGNQPKAKSPHHTTHTCEISHLYLPPAPYTPPTNACISD